MKKFKTEQGRAAHMPWEPPDLCGPSDLKTFGSFIKIDLCDHWMDQRQSSLLKKAIPSTIDLLNYPNVVTWGDSSLMRILGSQFVRVEVLATITIARQRYDNNSLFAATDKDVNSQEHLLSWPERTYLQMFFCHNVLDIMIPIGLVIDDGDVRQASKTYSYLTSELNHM